MSREHEKYERFIERARAIVPLPTAVAHPCEASALAAAVDAARMGLVTPILVGPGQRIKTVAAQSGPDLSGLEISRRTAATRRPPVPWSSFARVAPRPS